MDPDAINPWHAIDFAIEMAEQYGALEFLKAARECNMISIQRDWPEFKTYVGSLSDASAGEPF